MTTEYKPEHILGSMFEIRHPEMCDVINSHLENHSWFSVIMALKRCRASEAIVPGWDIHLREGTLRRGLMTYLGLEDFVGLDVDFLTAFADIDGDSEAELVHSAGEMAMTLLSEQVKRGNTFFMDVGGMKENEFALLVPDIIESRIREVERLCANPNLYEVYSTYYGFKILTTDVNMEKAGVPEDLKKNLIGILQEVGGVEEIRSKQLKFSPMAFRKCSPHQTALLWNMLRLARGGSKYKLKALKKLGDLGDTRAVDIIHSIIDSRQSVYRKDQLLDECVLCLG
ncbi:MAG: hypothetical protein ACXAAK_13515, partial [Candidatus Thorarchaeota archaeon]